MNDSKKSLLPALLAVGGGLSATPAAALELGEINIQSTLGQPLRASVAYALAPNEALADYCVTLQPGIANGGLPAVTNANISVGNGVISLTSRTIVREPLMALRLNVTCPYTPHLSREYLLFVDPPAYPVQVTVAQTAVAPAEAPSPTVVTANNEASTARSNPQRTNTTPVDPSQRYRVQPGDSLSEIAQRIENRGVNLWGAVAQIFDANPDAFIDNDPNRLKAGSWLVIPDFGPQATFAAATPTATAEAVPAAPDQAAAETTVRPIAEDVPGTAYPGIPADVAPPVDAVDDTDMLEPVSPPPVADLQPGDVILDSDFAVESTSDSPNVPVASIADPVVIPAESRTNWFLWLAGAGVALIAALFMFGRRRREVDVPEPRPQAPSHPMRRASDTGEVEAVAGVDYEIDDESPTEENLTLDADLVLGTGLSESTDMDVNQDFGFAVTTHPDVELPDEKSLDVDDVVPETDIIPPPSIDESSILKSEVLPDDDDYDMSVIVDATKMPQPDEVTERDFKAVVVNAGDDNLITDDYTVSQESDYQILEQDYEDEMTATQALNQEIEKVASQLAERMESSQNEALDADDNTTEMPLATVTELDVTANLPSGDDAASDGDATDVNKTIEEHISADDKTVEMPKKDHAG